MEALAATIDKEEAPALAPVQLPEGRWRAPEEITIGLLDALEEAEIAGDLRDLQASTEEYGTGEYSAPSPFPPGRVRTLQNGDFTADEIEALERQYGCKVKRPHGGGK